VRKIEASHFVAEIEGVKGEGVLGEIEDAEIPIADVSESDKQLLREGNFFRLCVLHEVDDTGQPSRHTRVIFRRLPAYRERDLAAARERAASIHSKLRVETADNERMRGVG
jgi:hypothetical protein